MGSYLVTYWIKRISENFLKKGNCQFQWKQKKWKKQKYSGKKYEQGKVETTDNFKECQGLLNFIKNYKYRGRVQGHYLIFILGKSLLAEKSYYQVQKRTMHGGVTLTMVVIMED